MNNIYNSEYKTWCENQGLNPKDARNISVFLQRIENDELVKCDVCMEYHEEKHMHRARFDYDSQVCPQCREDGN
jgi:hypothetical protein